MPPEHLVPWIALHLLPGVGPMTARRAAEIHGNAFEAAFRVPASAWVDVPGVDAATAEAIVAARPDLMRRADEEWKEAVRLDVRIVSREEPEYPSMLAALSDAPLVLYLKGAIPEGQVRVAIVGSRRASAYGRSVARSLAGELTRCGVGIVSGGARGIDTCAHLGALDAEGETVAVLGCGLSRVYPPENEPLFDRIAQRGGLISEFPMMMSPLPENFPRRNRLIAALSAATVVVEATTKSGSLITAAHALEQGREVMAVPGPVTSEPSRGCHRLIQQGAKLVERAEHVIEELSPMYRGALREGRPGPAGPGHAPAAERAEPRSADAGTAASAPSARLATGPGLSEDERAVLSLFDDPRPVHVERLAVAAPFGIARLQAALFALALRGCVEPMTGGYYVARPAAGSHGPVEG